MGNFRIGGELEISLCGRWYSAEVIDRVGNRIKVRSIKSTSKLEQWIEIPSDRIAVAGTHIIRIPIHPEEKEEASNKKSKPPRRKKKSHDEMRSSEHRGSNAQQATSSRTQTPRQPCTSRRSSPVVDLTKIPKASPRYTFSRTQNESLVKEIKENQSESLKQGLRRIKNTSAQRQADGIAEVSCTVPLTDPVSKSRIDTPARGKSCSHLSAFDLSRFLSQTPNASLERDCPICSSKIRNESILVDGFIGDILSHTKDVREVRVHPDGSWDIDDTSRSNKNTVDLTPNSRSTSKHHSHGSIKKEDAQARKKMKQIVIGEREFCRLETGTSFYAIDLNGNVIRIAYGSASMKKPTQKRFERRSEIEARRYFVMHLSAKYKEGVRVKTRSGLLTRNTLRDIEAKRDKKPSRSRKIKKEKSDDSEVKDDYSPDSDAATKSKSKSASNSNSKSTKSSSLKKPKTTTQSRKSKKSKKSKTS